MYFLLKSRLGVFSTRYIWFLEYTVITFSILNWITVKRNTISELIHLADRFPVTINLVYGENALLTAVAKLFYVPLNTQFPLFIRILQCDVITPINLPCGLIFTWDTVGKMRVQLLFINRITLFVCIKLYIFYTQTVEETKFNQNFTAKAAELINISKQLRNLYTAYYNTIYCAHTIYIVNKVKKYLKFYKSL